MNTPATNIFTKVKVIVSFILPFLSSIALLGKTIPCSQDYEDNENSELILFYGGEHGADENFSGIVQAGEEKSIEVTLTDEADQLAHGTQYALIEFRDSAKGERLIQHSVVLDIAEPSGWPMWRYDAARSADTPLELATELYLQWKREFPEPKRAWPHQWDDLGKLDFDVSYTPVVEGNRIFVPSNVTDSVTAYNFADGSKQWRFYTDGPVRLAPAVWEGKVYFISDDGYLYCVDTATGELEWKFRGGPSDHRLLGNERIINFWAARGGPVIKDGNIYFAAGVWPLHGVFIYALDAETGNVVWVNDTTSSAYVPQPHGGAYGYGGLAPQGYIAASGDELVISGGRGAEVYVDRQTGSVNHMNPRDHHLGGGGYAVHSDGLGYQTNSMLQNRVNALSNQIDGDVFYKLAANDRLYVTTECGKLYCFGPEDITPQKYDYNPRSLEPETGDWADAADDLLNELNDNKGYSLMLGMGSGDLLRELLNRSEMHIVVVESDSAKVRDLREELAETGMSGRRAAVIEAEPEGFSVQPYLFSLVISENAAAAGISADHSVMKRLLNMLRPYEGIAWLGEGAYLKNAAEAAEVDQVSVEERAEHLFASRGGPLTGAGEWTHQYHDTKNTNLSHDERVRLPLGILWFGGPNNHDILPRHAGGPRPQVAGGRQIYLGVETISARCVYTGRKLWERGFPGIGHPFTNLELEEKWRSGSSVYMTNIPGATYIGSPFVTLPEAIYLRYEGAVYRLDPVTGETISEFKAPGRSVAEIYNEENLPDWGHLSVRGDYLITTGEPHIFEDQALGWTESYSGTSSKVISVFDRDSEEMLWQRQADIGFRHNTVISNDDTLFLIDGLSKNALNHLARRGQEPEETSKLLALNLRTGEERWSRDSEVFSSFLLYSDEYDIILEGGSQDLRHTLDDEPSHTAARSGETGELLWTGGGFTLPGALRGEMLIPGRPGNAISLVTGATWMREQPITGSKIPWRYSRRYGCNTLSASTNLLLFRSGYAGYYDLEHDTGTGNLSGFRSGCTANMIAADGVLSALDYTRTCTCSYAIQTSLALIHMPDQAHIEQWTRYGENFADPTRRGINYGAPGIRVDSRGIVWEDAPGTHRRQASAVHEGDDDGATSRMVAFAVVDDNPGGPIEWVSSSALEAEEAVTFGNLPAGRYQLILHFAELEEGISSGERMFDVKINGETVLSEFDIIEESGGIMRGIVKGFEVESSTGSITVDLSRTAASGLDPMISGVSISSGDLNYIAGEGGYIEGETSQYVGIGEDGTEVKAVAREGFRFIQWSDGSTENPRRDLDVTEQLFVVAEFGLVLPYAQDFENLELGTAGGNISGWNAQMIDTSAVISRVDDYVHEVGYPLEDSTHTQILNVDESFVYAKFAVDKGEYPRIYLDKMIRIQTLTKVDRFKYLLEDEAKLALYLNENGELELFHGGEDGDTSSFTVLDSDYEINTWARLTVAMDMEGTEGEKIPFFRVFINGQELSSETEGFALPSPDPNDYTGGAWFRFANFSEQQVAGKHRSIGWVRYVGKIMIDDVVLSQFVPEKILPTRSIFTALKSEDKGGMSPAGERVEDSTYEFKVEEGAPAEITYFADKFYEIEMLTSDNQEIVAATGKESYRWRIDAVITDITNEVIFAAQIWDSADGGDDRTPLWWADKVGYTAGKELSVYESFLLNQKDLDKPFRIIEFGLNDDNRAFVKWLSSGPARGKVTVKTTDDLIKDREEWSQVSGETSHDEAQGINTWTAFEETYNSSSFYYVEIAE